MSLSPWAGKPAHQALLVNVPRLMTAYYTNRPDPSVPEHHVAFGTSGHRGSAFEHTFNEAHILAMTQTICLYRQQEQIDGPLFLGIDTHALSESAFASALEVLAANGWFAARPSGTEDVYKIYAESFQGEDHLHRLLDDAQALIDKALATATRLHSGGGHQ